MYKLIPVLARGTLAAPPVALLHLALDEYQPPPAGMRPTIILG